jgi:hypothetical protein
VFKEKPDAWVYGVSPPARHKRLEPITNAISQLANSRLGVASIIANFHHRRIIPLMERELHIYEMSNAANPCPWRIRDCWRNRLPRDTRPLG